MSGIFWPLTVLILLTLQWTIFPRIAVAGAFPNLLLLGTAFFALRKGALTGVWLGFFSGLSADALSLSLFGSQTFMYTLIGYGLGQICGKVNAEKPLAQITVIFSISYLLLVGLVFFELLFGEGLQRFLVKTSLLHPLYSAIIAPIAFFLLDRWHSFFYPVRSYRSSS